MEILQELKAGARFDPVELDFVQHKDYWIATNLGENAELSNLPKALQNYLDSWEAFSCLPGDDISSCYPEWIALGVSVDPETFLIWHTNRAVTDNGGPYIRLLNEY